jgi:glycosyl transferase, family 25
MRITLYYINLDRAHHRREALEAQAAQFDITLRRIAAVDGGAIASSQRRNVNERLFTRFNGRSIVPGEYGCYQSHLKALAQIVEDGTDFGVVLEDDIILDGNVMARIAAICAQKPDLGLVKLLNHRARGFQKRFETPLGDAVGRCLHGPQGSAAAYLVSRDAAARLLTVMLPMVYPWDIALERGWATGIDTLTVRDNVIGLGPLREETEIATIEQYRKVKLSSLRRLPTHLCRAWDYVLRIIYVWRP